MVITHQNVYHAPVVVSVNVFPYACRVCLIRDLGVFGDAKYPQCARLHVVKLYATERHCFDKLSADLLGRGRSLIPYCPL